MITFVIITKRKCINSANKDLFQNARKSTDFFQQSKTGIDIKTKQRKIVFSA